VRNIPLLAIFRMCGHANALIVATLIIFLAKMGFSLFDVAVLQCVFAASLLLGEIASSRWADHRGRKAVLCLGSALLATASFLYGTATNWIGVTSGEIVMGLGFALISGVDEALFVESLMRIRKGARKKELWARIQWMESGAATAFFLFGGWLSYHYGLPAGYYVSTTVFLIQMILVACMKETRIIDSHNTTNRAGVSLREVLLSTFHNSLLRSLIVTLGLIGGVSQLPFWCYSPYITEWGASSFQLGCAFAAMNLVSGYSSKVSASRKSYPLGMLLWFAACTGVLASVPSPYAMLAILGHQMVRGSLTVAYMHELHDTLKDSERATVLSLRSIATRLTYCCLLLPTYAIASRYGVRSGFSVIAVFSLLIVIYLLIWNPTDAKRLRSSRELKRF
jgi:MFS family permease